MFLKEGKYIGKRVIRDINDNLSDFSSDDESDDKKIKVIRLMVFERRISKMNFLSQEF